MAALGCLNRGGRGSKPTCLLFKCRLILHPVLLTLPLRILSVGSEQMAINLETHFFPLQSCCCAYHNTSCRPLTLGEWKQAKQAPLELWIPQQPLPCFMGAAHLCDRSERTGEGLSALLLYPPSRVQRKCYYLCQFPQACCYVAWTTVWQVGRGYRNFFPLEKDIFFSRKKSLCFLLSESADFVTKKTKGWRDSLFRFLSMKIRKI